MVNNDNNQDSVFTGMEINDKMNKIHISTNPY